MTIKTQVLFNGITTSLCLIIVSILTFYVVTWINPDKEENIGYDTATEYIRELQISYQGVKSDLVDLTQRYIDSVAPNSGLRALILVENCEKYGIPISFTLAQGEIESHFGTKGLAFRTNSIWNVGAYDGRDFNSIGHRYSNPNDSVVPYLDLLTTNYLPNKTVEDLLESFVDINGNRYASDKHYEAKLSDKYKYIMDNYRIDELQERLNYYKVRL